MYDMQDPHLLNSTKSMNIWEDEGQIWFRLHAISECQDGENAVKHFYRRRNDSYSFIINKCLT